MDLITAILAVSERAANIARCCRSNEHLVELLVQEKKGSDKNPRFIQDFKTLADVLIQETVRHIVGNKVLFLFFFFIKKTLLMCLICSMTNFTVP